MGDYLGSIIGFIKRDTRSLDYSSRIPEAPNFHSMFDVILLVPVQSPK